MEGHVLDKGCSAKLAGASDSGENAGTHVPPGSHFFGVGGEVRRLEEFETGQDFERTHYLSVELFLCRSLGLYEQGGETFAGGIVHGGKRFFIE